MGAVISERALQPRLVSIRRPTTTDVVSCTFRSPFLWAMASSSGFLVRIQLLQQDLRHPDVRKAMEHWTGHKRLSQDDADELMEDNYRFRPLFSSLGLKFSHVIVYWAAQFSSIFIAGQKPLSSCAPCAEGKHHVAQHLPSSRCRLAGAVYLRYLMCATSAFLADLLRNMLVIMLLLLFCFFSASSSSFLAQDTIGLRQDG